MGWLPPLLPQVYCRHGCEVMYRLRNLYFVCNNTASASLSGTTFVTCRERSAHVLGEVTLVQKCSKNCSFVSSNVLIGAVDPICYFVSLVHRYIGGHISGSPQVIFEIRGQPRMGGERAGLRLPGARTKVRGRGRRSARERAAVLWPVPRLRKGRALLPRRRQKPPNKRIKPQKRSMFQKGTKRKFADAGGEEEEEEEAALRTGVGIGVGALAGEDPMSLRLLSSYSLQRQTLLNMSLVKLQLCHMLVEPNLCRSVLIANTVRHIQEEMTYDLTWQVGAAADALSHAHAQAECLAASDRLCRSALTEEEPEQQPATPFNAIGYEGCDEDEEEEEEVVVDEDGDVPLTSVASSGPFLPGRLGASAGMGVGAGLGPRWQGEPMCHPEEMEDADDFGKGSGDADDEDEEEEEDVAAYDRTVAAGAAHGDRLAKTTEQIFSPLFETNRPTPVPEAALEELFSDVEASYYDLDSMLTGMQGAAAAGAASGGGGGGGGDTGVGVPKGTSFELLESLNSSHTQTHTQTPLNPTAGCRPDLSELDHIMEIIVGS
ncbi:uncharacterized protein LOC121718278 isoform X2 [Alosa sapidissima]|uniref:uncharacterized protein LOC121718278 isoform X2 n=1 Tax=Alosa sapidissima TaxID=34773 RepID=UPI001C091BAE|nr:uncharacterized protein LOC121718278 isoform X2 [Alosa sapidissima]